MEMLFPSNMEDSSRFRVIPDNQEVYVACEDPSSRSAARTSVGVHSAIVELLDDEKQGLGYEEALRFYWTDLLQANDAREDGYVFSRSVDHNDYFQNIVDSNFGLSSCVQECGIRDLNSCTFVVRMSQ